MDGEAAMSLAIIDHGAKKLVIETADAAFVGQSISYVIAVDQ